jgi:hypothetical protein
MLTSKYIDKTWGTNRGNHRDYGPASYTWDSYGGKGSEQDRNWTRGGSAHREDGSVDPDTDKEFHLYGEEATWLSDDKAFYVYGRYYSNLNQLMRARKQKAISKSRKKK